MGTLITNLGIGRRSVTEGAIDVYMISTTLVLIAFGLVAIWSADGGGAITPSSLVVRQLVFVIIGLPIILLMTAVDYRYMKSLAWIIYVITIGLLAAVMVLGQAIGGSTRWIVIGPILIQPSEIAKLGVIISLAAFISNRGDEMKSLVNFILSGILVLLPMLLVYQQPDLGTAGVFAFIWLSMILMSRTRLIYIAGALFSLPVIGYLGWRFFMHDYMRERLFNLVRATA